MPQPNVSMLTKTSSGASRCARNEFERISRSVSLTSAAADLPSARRAHRAAAAGVLGSQVAGTLRDRSGAGPGLRVARPTVL